MDLKKTHKAGKLRNLVVLSPKMNPALGEELQWIHEDFSTPHKSFDRINGFSLRDITWAEVQSLSDGMETFLTCYCFKTRISEERALKGLRHMCNIRSKFLLGKYGVLKKRNSHLLLREFFFPEIREDGILHFHGILFVPQNHPRLSEVEEVTRESFLLSLAQQKGVSQPIFTQQTSDMGRKKSGSCERRLVMGPKDSFVNLKHEEQFSLSEKKETYVDIVKCDSLENGYSYATKEFAERKMCFSSLDWIPKLQAQSFQPFSEPVFNSALESSRRNFTIAPRRTIESAIKKNDSE
jgi:hypothetical protein